MEHRRHRRGCGADHRHAGAWAGRPLSAAGRDRCGPRRGPSAEDTDWAQITALYGLQLDLDDNPVVALNHAVALAMSPGPATALELLTPLEADARVAGGHRLPAVRAHLLEMLASPGPACGPAAVSTGSEVTAAFGQDRPDGGGAGTCPGER